MIWRSVVNILWALVRNAFQHGHHCTALGNDRDGWGWVWECSCGNWGVNNDTEVEAIKDFSRHVSAARVSA